MLEWCGEWCAFGGFLLLLLSPLSRGLLTQLWVWSQALDSAHALGDFTTHAQNQVGSQATRDRAARRLGQFELPEEYCASRGFGPLSKKAFTRRKFDYLAELGLVEIKEGSRAVGFRSQRLFVVLSLLLSLQNVLLGSVLIQKFLLI